MKRIYPSPFTIPSQRPSNLRPGNPDIQADMIPMPKLQRRHRVAGMPGTDDVQIPNSNFLNSVLSIWDSRPINSNDFLATSPVAPILDVTNREFTFNIPVPEGRVMVIRRWEISTIFATSNPANPVTNPNGTSNVIVLLNFQIDGVDIVGYSLNQFNTLPFGAISDETFILIGPGSVFSIFMQILNTVPAPITMLDGQIQVGGTLLMASGRDLGLEMSSEYPIGVSVR